MYDKFRIIDFVYVMHSSYNQSKNTWENKKNLTTNLDKDFI